MNNKHPIRTFTNGLVAEDTLEVVKEFPLTIFINNVEYKTLLCSPSHIEPLIFGLLKNDFLISNHEEILEMVLDDTKGLAYIKLDLDIQNHMSFTRRYITSGCASSAMYFETLDAIKLRSKRPKSYSNVDILFALNTYETLRDTIGEDCPFACLKDSLGFEMIHKDCHLINACHKINGDMLTKKIAYQNKVLFISEMLTAEVVLMCAKMDIKVIVFQSVASDLSIKIAESANIILIEYLEGKKGNVYTGFEHVKM